MSLLNNKKRNRIVSFFICKILLKIIKKCGTDIKGDECEKCIENCFNTGTISIDDSDLNTPISSDGLDHRIGIGEIVRYDVNNSRGNKFTNQNGFAAGCVNFTGSSNCTAEQSAAVGTYTTDSVPDILSIINGDEAFEIKEGETLPTLKVFNE